MDSSPELEPRKSPRQRRAQETVKAILQATAQVLSEHGYAKTSTNKVARVAGVSIGSLYQYFPNKEALIIALFDRHTEEVLTSLGREILEMAREPLPEAVTRLVRFYLRLHTRDPRLQLAMTQQAIHLGPERVAVVQDRAVSAVTAFLSMHRDEILPKNLEMTAFVLVTTVQGVIHAAILERPEALHDPALEAELLDLLLRYLQGGR